MKNLIFALLFLISGCNDGKQETLRSGKKIILNIQNGIIRLTTHSEKTVIKCSKGTFRHEKSDDAIILKANDSDIDCSIGIFQAEIQINFETADIVVHHADKNIGLTGQTLRFYMQQEKISSKYNFFFPANNNFYFSEDFKEFVQYEEAKDKVHIKIVVDRGAAAAIVSEELQLKKREALEKAK